jgi:chromosome segregation ATPase
MLRNELTTASTDLDQSRLSLEELQERFEMLNSTRTAMEGQLSSVTAERNEAREQAKTLEANTTELERSLLRLRERLTLLDRDYRQLTEQLAQAQVAPSEGVSAVIATGPKNHMASRAPAVTALSPGTVELPPIRPRPMIATR